MALDFFTAAICLCLGNAVAWLVALYTERGMRLLIWNVFFGIVGATLAALSIAAIAPPAALVWLVAVGPFGALVAIFAGQAARRAFLPARSG